MRPHRRSVRSTDALALRRVLTDLADRYPEPLRSAQRRDVERVAFHIELAHRPGGRIADLGGGIGLFSLGCAAIGGEVWLVDDFGDPVNAQLDIEDLTLHRELGVRVVRQDVRAWSRDIAPLTFDAVTSFLSVEHWHACPHNVLHDALRLLRPGGVLVLSTLNGLRLRRRVGVALGWDEPARFDEWYRADPYRARLRELTSGDLRRIAQDLRLDEAEVFSRNWITGRGLSSRLLDRMTRPIPALGTDLYLIGRKAALPPGTA